MIGVGEPLSADRRSIVMSWFLNPFGVRSCRALLRTTKHQRQIIRLSVVPSTIFWGMSRELLKLSGSLVHDYATISDDSPSPNRASRARRAATSAGIS